MEVKPGYKQTEAGVIPDEWEVKNLGAFVTYTNGKAHENNITDSGRFVVVNSKFISTEGDIRKYSNHCFCPTSKGDVLMVMSDVPNGRAIAKCYLVERDETYTVNQRICILSPQTINAKLLFYKLDRNPYYLAFDDGAKQTNLRKDDVLTCPLGIPKSDDEQRAIAGTLSDVDALLGALDELIAKKRDLKQATMQQLLTGQTRLPGFHGEWDETTFGNIIRHHAGNSTLIKGKLRSTESAGLYPAYSASGQDVWCEHYEHEGEAIVVSAVGSRCGKAFVASGKWCAIANTHVVWPNVDRVNRRFLGFYINDENFWLKSGSGQPFVLFKQTFARPLRLPRVAEQTAIAEVLTDLDAELAALEQRRAKTRALKQGMMQELLTGRTRLVANVVTRTEETKV